MIGKKSLPFSVIQAVKTQSKLRPTSELKVDTLSNPDQGASSPRICPLWARRKALSSLATDAWRWIRPMLPLMCRVFCVERQYSLVKIKDSKWNWNTKLEQNSWVVSHSAVSDSWNPMDCSPPGSSVCGILQARILEWVAIPFSRGSSQARDWTRVSCPATGLQGSPLQNTPTSEKQKYKMEFDCIWMPDSSCQGKL